MLWLLGVWLRSIVLTIVLAGFMGVRLQKKRTRIESIPPNSVKFGMSKVSCFSGGSPGCTRVWQQMIKETKQTTKCCEHDTNRISLSQVRSPLTRHEAEAEDDKWHVGRERRQQQRGAVPERRADRCAPTAEAPQQQRHHRTCQCA